MNISKRKYKKILNKMLNKCPKQWNVKVMVFYAHPKVFPKLKRYKNHNIYHNELCNDIYLSHNIYIE